MHCVEVRGSSVYLGFMWEWHGKRSCLSSHGLRDKANGSWLVKEEIKSVGRWVRDVFRHARWKRHCEEKRVRPNPQSFSFTLCVLPFWVFLKLNTQHGRQWGRNLMSSNLSVSVTMLKDLRKYFWDSARRKCGWHLEVLHSAVLNFRYFGFWIVAQLMSS